MEQEQIEALLGRSLTTIESTNFQLYLDIATQNLEDIICTPIEPVTEDRVFDTRESYSTVFLDIFTAINSVTRDGTAIDSDDYQVRQWDKRNGGWFNSIVLDCKEIKNDELTINADWGFTPSSGSDPDIPPDLQAVLAGLFDLISKKNHFDGTISRKQVEDFEITFNKDSDLDEEFDKKYSATIRKYSLCEKDQLRHGRFC